MIVISGGFIAVGCLLYPLGWNNAEVVQACTALAHQYNWGQYTVVFRGATLHQKVVVTWVGDMWRARGARAYNGGLGAEPLVGSQGAKPL